MGGFAREYGGGMRGRAQDAYSVSGKSKIRFTGGGVVTKSGERWRETERDREGAREGARQ